MEQQAKRPLALPALRAQLGQWVYYITYMKMADVSERIGLAEEEDQINSNRSLSEWIQRKIVTKHVNGIVKYIMTQPDMFFNAMVIGVYGSVPQWFELSIRQNEPDGDIDI